MNSRAGVSASHHSVIASTRRRTVGCRQPAGPRHGAGGDTHRSSTQICVRSQSSLPLLCRIGVWVLAGCSHRHTRSRACSC
jgi:hypothetical protein